MKVRLTNPRQEPFTHQELAKQVNIGTKEQPLWDWEYEEYKKGDVISVSEQTAEHLIISGQAEKLKR